MNLATATLLHRRLWREDGVDDGPRITAEEIPVAIVHDGSTTAVMMATPDDLEDFAVGFSLTEGVIEDLSDIRGLDVVETELGIEARVWLEAGRSARFAARRRRLVGPTGCGLCGVESLAEAVKPPPPVDDEVRLDARDIVAAMAALGAVQPLGRATRAVHAAALLAEGGLALAREDVGRHNALDKLIGAAARDGVRSRDAVLLTSRVSVEMVQKAAVMGAPILCAVSAPTALAVRIADQAGITLVGVVRNDGLEVFTHADRIALG